VKRHSVWRAIVPAMILATIRAAHAQSVGYSPGAALDQQSWEEFISAVTTVAGGELEFETWKTDAETFQAPVIGLAAAQTSRFQASILGLAHMPGGLRSGVPLSVPLPLPVPCGAAAPNPDIRPPPTPPPAAYFPTPATTTPPFGCVSEEVRRNPLAYGHIVDNQLNTQAGLIAAYKAGGAIPPFPDGAVELKADWIPLSTLIQWLKNNGKTVTASEVAASYYHITQASTEYALVAMHLSIKTEAHPHWVWATFEHQWNPGRCDTMGCYDDYGIQPSLAAIAPVPLPPSPHPDTLYPNCVKSPALAAKFRTANLGLVWNNYCLKETEVDFVSTQSASKGQPVLDGNSLTERIAAGASISSSSCIACHANASYTVVGLGSSARAAANKAIGDAPIGQVTVQRPYMTYDSAWGLAAIPQMFPAE
jgi:mono/diheme cytochrome c family protein